MLLNKLSMGSQMKIFNDEHGLASGQSNPARMRIFVNFLTTQR